jgi:hypothetical protein
MSKSTGIIHTGVVLTPDEALPLAFLSSYPIGPIACANSVASLPCEFLRSPNFSKCWRLDIGDESNLEGFLKL